MTRDEAVGKVELAVELMLRRCVLKSHEATAKQVVATAISALRERGFAVTDANLLVLLNEYLNEWDAPVKDPTLRISLRKRLRDMLEAVR